jgi:hypothetical protein
VSEEHHPPGYPEPHLLPEPPEGPGASRRAAFLIGAALLTAAVLIAAIFLGAWALDYRRLSLHEARVAKLVPVEATAEQIHAALEAEGTRQIAEVRGASALEGVLTGRGVQGSGDVLRAAEASAQTRIYLAGEVLYVLHFDADGVIRDFACLTDGRPEDE